MLFNCFQCGKRISSKGKLCPYCTVNIETFTSTLTQEKGSLRKNLEEKYKGSIFSYVLREKL